MRTSWLLIFPALALIIGLGANSTALAQSAPPAGIARENLAALEATQAGFRQIHDLVGPAVVSITSQAAPANPQPMAINPLDLFFGIPQAPRPQVAPRRSTGSGVIIRSEGIVLTNSHVVQGATKVTVQLSGEDKDLPAEVIQTDPRTDLAVLRITEKGKYPVATLGDAAKVRVGDWAIAFGSPFRLSSTMTVGIISATGRRLRSPDEDFTFNNLLQTDASINPGNSGGPLVNIRGEVIGINFMIFSPGDNAGSVGIGFAIPIDVNTRRIIDTLAAGQAVERGRLGIIVKNLDKTMRDAFGVPADRGGIFIDSVAPGLAAEKSGLQAEDIILDYNGTAITNVDQFVGLVEHTQPGTTVPVTILRDKKVRVFSVQVGGDAAATVSSNPTKLGLALQTLTPELADRLRLPITQGALVVGVIPGSAAEEAGLSQGDVIIRLGDDKVTSKETFGAALGKALASAKRSVIMRVLLGNGLESTLTIELPDEK